IRKRSARANRGTAEEPREKRQFLEVIGDAVGHLYRRKPGHPAQGVTNLQVGLTASDLASMSPRGSGVVHQWIVSEFGNLMAQNLSVERHRRVVDEENPGAIVIGDGVKLRLRGQPYSAVEAKDAAVRVSNIGRRPIVHEHIVEEKDRKVGWSDTLRLELWDQSFFGDFLESVHVNDRDRLAPTEGRRVRHYTGRGGNGYRYGYGIK